MYAALVSVKIDPDQADAARSMLESQVVPTVKAAPGFIAGYWLEPTDGKGFSFVVFETEDQARQTAPPAGASPAPGVTVDTVEFRPVIAQA
jgi:quinol monooxygenase YgiN